MYSLGVHIWKARAQFSDKLVHLCASTPTTGGRIVIHQRAEGGSDAVQKAGCLGVGVAQTVVGLLGSGGGCELVAEVAGEVCAGVGGAGFKDGC